MSKFVHHELNTSDPKAAKKFYKGLFGWKYEDMPMPHGVYTMVMAPDGAIGGIQQNPMPGAPSAWLGYVTVDSITRTTKKVEKLGGKTLVPRTVIPDIGEFAIYEDSTGASFACWRELAKPKKTTKKASKKRSTKKTAKKTAKKKRSTKKTAKKTTKKRSTKKTAKKSSTKKAAKKRSTTKRATKKGGKKGGKKTTKKTTKKRSTKKTAKKRKR